ncbi:MAG: hypothetical protein KDD44_12125, partial [Bdellovibrionales bacterium]|nr:hypothetical protein [Bdellovibrionales bacterium]
IGVLLDAENAARYLSADKQRGTALAAAAEECAGLDADLSVPLCGTLLRDVLEQMKDTYAVRSDASESDDGQE